MKKIFVLLLLIVCLPLIDKNLNAQVFSFEHNGTNQMIFSEVGSTQFSYIANKAYYNFQFGMSPIKNFSISIAYSKYRDIEQTNIVTRNINNKSYACSLGWYYDFNRKSNWSNRKNDHWHVPGSTIGLKLEFQRNNNFTIFSKSTFTGVDPRLNLTYHKFTLLLNYNYRYKYGQFNFAFNLSQIAYQSIVVNGNRAFFPYSFNLSVIPEYNPFKVFSINVEKQFGLKALRVFLGLNLNFPVSKKAAIVVDRLGYSYLGVVVDLKHLGFFQ